MPFRHRGIWAGTTEDERVATAHLPRAERIAALEAVFETKAREVLAPQERIA